MIEIVREFARAYINTPLERTPERKSQIRQAYREVTGVNMSGSCRTCYIEALFKIINYKNMTANYELKKGVLLQEFGHPEKACTNLTLTDELAKWHLERHPEKAVLFAKLPGNHIAAKVNIVPPKIIIVPPVQKEVPKEVPPEEVHQTADKLIEAVIKPRKSKK
jgi:hypothetical protein